MADVPWDDGKPHGNITVSQLDNETREQLLYIKDALAMSMNFPDTQPGDSGKMLEGSARVEVTNTTATPDIGTISGGDDTAKGAVAYFTDTGKAFFCTNGTNDTWAEITGLTGPLTLDGALTLDAGATLSDSQTLTVPDAESWLDDGTNQMDPFTHAARHEVGGDDALANLIANVIQAGPGAATLSFSAINPGLLPLAMISTAWDLSSRSASTTHALIYARALIKINSGNSSWKFSIESDQDGRLFAFEGTNNGDGGNYWDVQSWQYVTGISNNSHVISFEVTDDVNESASTGEYDRAQITIVDLGEA